MKAHEPAFPSDRNPSTYRRSDTSFGLSKYEYFLAKAFQAYIIRYGDNGKDAAKHVIASTDALMKELEKKG